MSIRIAMICGSWPPQLCGVGDYSKILADKLEDKNLEIYKIKNISWEWSARREIEAKIRAANPDIVHIQYPSRGFGASRIPAWLVFRLRNLPTVVTLHEYSAQVGDPIFGLIPRGMPHYIPFSCADALVFSSDYESRQLARVIPWVRNRSHIIPIASNVGRGANKVRKEVIVHFGQVCPGKGLERFIEFSALINKHSSSYESLLLGSVPQGHETWAKNLLSSAPTSGFTYYGGLEASDIADYLATSRYAYLPYPDGASAKRGSLLACLLNGVIVITKHSDITPDWIREVTLHADNPDHAMRIILDIETNIECQDELSRKAASSAALFDWNLIASKHIHLYSNLLSRY